MAITAAGEAFADGDAGARSAQPRQFIVTVYGLYARADGGWLSVASLIALLADLIIQSARRRPESRGLHYNLDHPEKDARLAKDTLVARGDGPVI